MSREQLSRPEALEDVSNHFQEKEQPKSPTPSPVQSSDERGTGGRQRKEPPMEAELIGEKQEQPKTPVPSPVQPSKESGTGAGQQQEERPIEAELIGEKQELKPESHAMTYGEVFPAMAAQGSPLAGEFVTTEDASLMQTAEAMAFGHTLKDGAASVMQSAAAKNVRGGFVERDAHSLVSEYGVGVSETSVPGAVMDIEYVGGQPVAGSGRPTSTDPSIAALDAVTIGEALEAAAMGAGDRPVEDSDARAIESAERRATGISMPMKGGIGAIAQSAAQLNRRVDEAGQTTLSDILMDASSDLPADKVVTYEDAYRVLKAELRGRDVEDLAPGGVGASLLAAADINALSGLTPPALGSLAEERRQLDLDGEDSLQDDAEKHNYQPMETADLTKPSEGEGLFSSNKLNVNPRKIQGTEEETTPLVGSKGAEQVPSHGSEQLPAPTQT